MLAAMAATAGFTAVVLLPVAFGGGPTWAWSSAAVVLGLAVALRGAATLAGRRAEAPLPPALRCALAAAAALVVWTLWQAFPGVPGAHPVWAAGAGALSDVAPDGGSGSGAGGRWSLAPARALPGAVYVALMAATLWLAATAPPRLVRRSPEVIAGAAALAALHALLVLHVGSEQVLWQPKQDYRDVATGVFVNRNAFAAYLGLGLLALAAAVQARIVRGEGVWPWSAPLAVLLVAALVGTESRGGVLATVLALSFVAVLWAGRDRRPGAWLAAAAVAGVAWVGAFAALHGRLSGLGAAVARRVEIYEATLAAVAARPWLGHGAGGFPAAFRAARPDDLDRVVTQAHSIYLQALTAWGIPATVLALTAGLMLGTACLGKARRGSALGLAGAGSVVLLGTHGLIDFAPQVPGVALTAAWLTGAGAAAHPTPMSAPR
jgi:O-antigen ligase